MKLIGRNMWATTVSEPDILEMWLAGVWKRRRMRWNLKPQVRKMRWPPAFLWPELSKVAASIMSSWLEITSFCSPQLTVELVRPSLVLRINREKETNWVLPVHVQSMNGQVVAFEYSLFLFNINKWAWKPVRVRVKIYKANLSSSHEACVSIAWNYARTWIVIIIIIIKIFQSFIHSFYHSYLSRDRPIASSKASSLQRVI